MGLFVFLEGSPDTILILVIGRLICHLPIKAEKVWCMKQIEVNKLLTHATESNFEMLGLIKFASHMSVCPNSIRNWIKNGKLVEGKHYFHIGHIYRFPWGPDFVKELMRSLAPEPSISRPGMRSSRMNRSHLKFRT